MAENGESSSTSKDVCAENELFNCMMKGTHIVKINHTGKGHDKKLYLDEDKGGFRYKPTKKKFVRFEIGKITELVPGECEQEKFRKFSKNRVIDRCLSVKFGDSVSLEMVFDSIEDLKRWSMGIDKLRLNRGTAGEQEDKMRDQWLIKQFESFDKNKDGTLGLREVTRLLDSLNVKMSPRVVRRKFEDVNKNGPGEGTVKGGLTKEEFADFFKDIARRDDLNPLLEEYAPDGFFTVDSLEKFLQNEQHILDANSAYCEEIIEKFEPTTAGKENKQLGVDGFTRYLLSDDGDIFRKEHLKIYQDMKQPLSHYFIASSHNTYLMEDQLRGPSSLDAYKNAFNKGCRCVELDCWDGDDGEPVVYHGHTLTSKILFRDIIEVVKEYAFKVSEYPVILSLENHCSIPQQKIMASHMESILGDLLYKEQVNSEATALPSPEFFKHKILIKGKKLKPEQEQDEEEEEGGDVTDEDEAAAIEQNAQAPSMNAEGGEGTTTGRTETAPVGDGVEDVVDGNKNKTTKVKKGGRLRRSFRAVSKAVGHGKTATNKLKLPITEKQHKKVKLAKELSRLVNYISSVGFKTFEQSEASGKPHQMSSFVESKVINLATNQGPDFVKYNCRQLSRTYPAGGRVDSSNYNPQQAWNVGCQIVALNYQTDGEMLHLNMGRFRENGRAGYNLKPEVLRKPSMKVDYQTTKGTPGVPKTHLKIKVFSGQQLPKPEGDTTKGEIIDPYVKIDIHGIRVDCHSHKTKVKKDNGFNPYWGDEEPLKKDLLFAEVAMIRFSVFDQDVGFDDFIGECSVPFTSLQQGYRHVHLANWAGKPLEHASLFVHVEIQEDAGVKRKSKAS